MMILPGTPSPIMERSISDKLEHLISPRKARNSVALMSVSEGNTTPPTPKKSQSASDVSKRKNLKSSTSKKRKPSEENVFLKSEVDRLTEELNGAHQMIAQLEDKLARARKQNKIKKEKEKDKTKK